MCEIRDDRLYEEDGFQTWDSYLKERVGEVFGIKRRQAQRLAACAEIRPKLNRATCETHDSEWSTRSLLEMGRLAPQKKLPTGGAAKDYAAISATDAQQVAKRAEEMADGGSVTSTHIRKAVDEKLGAKPKPKWKYVPLPEPPLPNLGLYLYQQSDELRNLLKELEEVPRVAWGNLPTRHLDCEDKDLVTGSFSLDELSQAVDELKSFLDEAKRLRSDNREAVLPTVVPSPPEPLPQLTLSRPNSSKCKGTN